MTSSSEFSEAVDPERSRREKHFPVHDSDDGTGRSMLLLEKLATTLGVPVERFFAEIGPAKPSEGATSEDIADLTQAFVAITDPVMRRYCLDVVRAASATDKDDGRAAASA